MVSRQIMSRSIEVGSVANEQIIRSWELPVVIAQRRFRRPIYSISMPNMLMLFQKKTLWKNC